MIENLRAHSYRYFYFPLVKSEREKSHFRLTSGWVVAVLRSYSFLVPLRMFFKFCSEHIFNISDPIKTVRASKYAKVHSSICQGSAYARHFYQSLWFFSSLNVKVLLFCFQNVSSHLLVRVEDLTDPSRSPSRRPEDSFKVSFWTYYHVSMQKMRFQSINTQASWIYGEKRFKRRFKIMPNTANTWDFTSKTPY